MFCAGVSPTDAGPRLRLGRLHRFQTAAEGFGHVRPAQEGKPDDGAGLGAETDPHPGQTGVEEKELHQQRGVPGELNIAGSQLPQNRHTEIPRQAAQKPQHQRAQNPAQPEPQGDPRPAQIVWYMGKNK